MPQVTRMVGFELTSFQLKPTTLPGFPPADLGCLPPQGPYSLQSTELYPGPPGRWVPAATGIEAAGVVPIPTLGVWIDSTRPQTMSRGIGEPPTLRSSPPDTWRDIPRGTGIQGPSRPYSTHTCDRRGPGATWCTSAALQLARPQVDTGWAWKPSFPALPHHPWFLLPAPPHHLDRYLPHMLFFTLTQRFPTCVLQELLKHAILFSQVFSFFFFLTISDDGIVKLKQKMKTANTTIAVQYE